MGETEVQRFLICSRSVESSPTDPKTLFLALVARWNHVVVIKNTNVFLSAHGNRDFIGLRFSLGSSTFQKLPR